MCDMLKIGDRVYYADNGSDDTGTVNHIDLNVLPARYGVDWDVKEGSSNDADLFIRTQLSKVD